MYTLLLVGYPAPTDGDINSSVHMFIHYLEKYFRELPNVKVTVVPVTAPVIEGQYDFALFHSYLGPQLTKAVDMARTCTKYKVCSFLELSMVEGDYSFTYMPTIYPNFTVIPAPIVKEAMQVVEKEKKTILLDHAWMASYQAHNNKDWSMKIIQWLEELTPEYTIYRLRMYDDTVTFPSYIKEIKQTNFKDYLHSTATMETFIVTHLGSYNSTVIDMLGRGTRILCPETYTPFIPRYNVNLFNIPIFTTQEQLLTEIKKPIEPQALQQNINKCTDMREVVSIINKQFEEWMKQ